MLVIQTFRKLKNTRINSMNELPLTAVRLNIHQIDYSNLKKFTAQFN